MNLIGMFRQTWQDLRRGAGLFLAWQLLTQSLALVVATPLLGGLAEHLVRGSGSDVISNYDIVRLVLSPPGLLFVLLTASLAVSFYIAQFAGYAWIGGHVLSRRAISLRSTLGAVAIALPQLVRLGLQMLWRGLWMAWPFVGLLVLAALATLADHDLNDYLAAQPPEWHLMLTLSIALGAVLVFLLVLQWGRWSFAIPAVMFEQASASRALETSAQMLKGRRIGMLKPLLLWWLVKGLAFVVCLHAAHLLSDRVFDWAGVEPARVLPLVAVFMTLTLVGSFVFVALHFGGHQLLTLHLYAQQLQKPLVPDGPAIACAEATGASLFRPVWGLTAGLTVLCAGMAAFLVQHLDAPDPVAVSAHRGASLQAPENTMAAFRAAWESGADFVELDVQRTREGVVIVLHDGDLLRMAGDPRKVKDLSLAEIQALDIGRHRGQTHAGERVPTLAEVIDFARGRVRLNIELKYNTHDEQLAPAVIDLLRAGDFLDPAVITSLDYAALLQVKAHVSNLQRRSA